MKRISLYASTLALSTFLFSCSSVNMNRFGGSDMEVAASKPRNTQTVKETVVAENEKTESTVAVVAAEEAPVAAPKTKAVAKFNENAKKLATQFETLTASTEDAFAKKTLAKTAASLKTLNVNEDKLSFTDKIKIRLFGKLLNKYADKVSGAMDTADILAICALVSGILALISYYGSFLFGVAAIVLGVIALKKGTSKRGMALAGIIMGAIGLLFWILFIAVIAAILI